MATVNKSKVSDIAKDFGMTSKDILAVLADYTDSPKKPSQVLEDNEINFVFEYLTQKNQAKIETIFAEGIPEKKETPKQEVKPAASAAPSAPAAKTENKNTAPAAQPVQQKKSTATQQPTTRVPEKKIVDTRKATNVNLDKYDEKLQDMAERSSDRRMNQSNKEKFRNAGKNKGGKQQMTFSNKRKQEEAEKMRRLQLEIAKKTPLTVKIPDEISVGELASRMKKTGAEVVKCLMKNGVMAALSQMIDFDTASFVAEELGCKVEKEVVVTIEEKLIDDHQDTEEELQLRAPVVVVMGHVDHGKTSLLDYIRNASVASGEAGGITQHIGAYQVQINGKPITFLDTPGHEAFTSMRARGAMITDIAILVVAAEDGIKPQTVESINHAKAAEIPIIVAINKMDKPDANPERVKQQLTEYGLLAEDWGGDTIVCPISAKTGMGVDNLLEMVALTAEVGELKANPNRAASGAVVEARLDKGRGPVATLLVQNGTLKQGDIIIAGTAVGRVRQMMSDKGAKLASAGPSVPVEITGLGEVPEAGAHFNAVADERLARELVEQRKEEEKLKANAPVTKVSLEDLFSQIQAGEMKNLNIIVKADVMGSVEAVKASLEKISNEEVRVRVIHGAVGAINESDVMLASTSNAIIVGFNVRPDAVARESAARNHVDMRMYRVIYDAIDEIEAAMKGMLAPKFREAVIGHAEVRQTYKVSSVGTVAGCYVTDGKIQRACDVRIVRDGIVVHEGHLASLQRFKDAVKEVASGYECGLSFEKYNDIKLGDVVEAYVMEQIEA
ncbi:MAG: translation initiation factor IF-2 [Eubacteriales bacterium]|nr:translation initiation factor IF-2 [Eubacteriales bacterium]